MGNCPATDKFLDRDYLGERLVWILRTSREALSAQELGAMLGISGRRVGAIVSSLRRAPNNTPILSTPREGYYWPRKLGDEHETVASLRSRISEIEEVIEGIETGMQDMFHQQSFPFEEAV